MPSTIKNHAIDYNKDGSIDLKNIEDSFASAANYLSNLGWNDNTPCFYRINLNENIPDKYLNTSAKKIKHERKVKYLKNYIKNSSFLDKYDNLTAAIVTPDAEIVENANKLKPAYIIFNNYKLILKWNRSLRFSLAVCTLKNSFENET
jgi:membrane-bound lytic murein transglycosylase B